VSRDNTEAHTEVGDVRNAVEDVLSEFSQFVVGWVQRRNILVQFAIAGVVTKTVEFVGDTFISISLETVPTFDEAQILVAVVGILIGQTFLQTKKRSEVRDKIATMEGEARADGGRATPEKRGTSGGGALGGAIAGGALGASYGLPGVVGGALVGAILGDNFEQWTESIPDSQPHDTRDHLNEK
jgi:hypothetical protein